MQRKTVLINRDIYSMLKDLNSNDRHIIWDLVLESLFDGKMPSLEEDSMYSDSIKNSFILLRYELNKLQKQYDNGKKNTQKKSTQNSTQSFCPFEDTQSVPTIAKEVHSVPSTSANINVSYNISNNKNNNNKINNNIYNINNIDNKQTNKIINNKYISKDLCDFTLTQENREVAEFWKDTLQEKIKEVADLNPVLTSRFSELVNRVAEQVRPIKLQGYYTAPEVVLEKYLNFFRCDHSTEIIKRLNQIYEGFEIKTTTTNINNTFKYLVAYFYNKACEI